MVKKELAAVGPAVVREITPAIEKTIPLALSDCFQRGVVDKAVKLKKSVNSKLETTVSRQIQAQFQTSGKQALQDAIKSSMEASVVPAFEKSCKAMFEQVDATVEWHFQFAHSPFPNALRTSSKLSCELDVDPARKCATFGSLTSSNYCSTRYSTKRHYARETSGPRGFPKGITTERQYARETSGPRGISKGITTERHYARETSRPRGIPKGITPKRHHFPEDNPEIVKKKNKGLWQPDRTGNKDSSSGSESAPLVCIHSAAIITAILAPPSKFCGRGSRGAYFYLNDEFLSSRVFLVLERTPYLAG
ncbi:hypothetical protein ACLB2K_030841 [Fragaria x ananassa]